MNIDVVLLYALSLGWEGVSAPAVWKCGALNVCTLTLETGDTFLPHPIVSSSFYATMLCT